MRENDALTAERSAAGTRRTEKQNDKRAAIIAACSDLFFAKSYDAVSVRDIEQATGLTRGAIYYYFAGKEDIYGAVVLEGMRDFHAVVREAVARCEGDPAEQIFAVGKAFARFFEDDRPFYDNLQRFFFNRRPNMALSESVIEAINAEARAVITLLVHIIEAGNAADTFACADPEFAAMAAWGMLVTTVQMTDENERMQSLGRSKDRLLSDLRVVLLRLVGGAG